MPTLRDQVKETLAAKEPDANAARADLETVMKRIDRRRRRWILLPAIGGPLVAAAAILVFVTRPLPRVGVSPDPSSPQAIGGSGGVHLYLHVEGEPADRALAIDLNVEGLPR